MRLVECVRECHVLGLSVIKPLERINSSLTFIQNDTSEADREHEIGLISTKLGNQCLVCGDNNVETLKLLKRSYTFSAMV